MEELKTQSSFAHSLSYSNDADLRSQLYENGFLFFKKENFEGMDVFLERINLLNSNFDLFEFQAKQKGTATLDLAISRDEEFFVKSLFETGVIKKIYACLGMSIFLTNFKHYLSKGVAPALGWHRDTYIRNHKSIGPIPATYKVAIYSSKTDKLNACTELLAGTHRLDLNSKFFDNVLASIGYRYKYINAMPGDVMLFNTSILHNRRRAVAGTFRSATIYNFSLSRSGQNAYLEHGHKAEIDIYNDCLAKYPTLLKH